MNSISRFAAAALGLFVIFSGSCHAGSVAGTGGSTEVTQILNNTELVTQTYQKAKSLEIQIQSALTDPNTPWAQAMSMLSDLRDVVNTGQAIGYDMAHIEQKFQSLYPSYSKTNGAGLLNNLVNWSNTTKSSLQNALNAGGMTVSQIQSEGTLLDTLRQKGQSATGQMQSLQVGNAIAVQTVEQLQRLTQLQAAQNQAHNAYLLGQQAKQDQQAGANDQFMTVTPMNWGGRGMKTTD
ncbi:P-type conjugative transfer protein TrbJ [Caballeronia sp. LP003]|uniref:P-type conjugative transfer protein TrbJ n=1 Tax=Caballeronia sp. LP003 TaxID=3038551 RepID=UPI0028615CF6|nr:P-type conjugative transfer protein TrbJ [Caballeronia sp. LP003]MDR5791723.1 P-type conjugative transfer protein TrbJ [Caballeronia sp. LP003]